jgi:acyl-coenzyme A synthetase/AMP-(fatty) acid ligase
MLSRRRFFENDLPSLRTMTQAGGHLSNELQLSFAQWANRKGIRFVVMYGQTEATARMSYLPSELSRSKIGSVGYPVPGGAFRIIDKQEEEVTQDYVTGELVYEGPNVAMGYATSIEDLAHGDEWGGVLHTGDMAHRDRDGCYFIDGRRKRFLKVFGNRINLDEVERLVLEHYPYVECAATGVDDLILVYLTDQSVLEEARLMLAAVMRISQRGIKVRHIDRIPRNAAGKVAYNLLSRA